MDNPGDLLPVELDSFKARLNAHLERQKSKEVLRDRSRARKIKNLEGAKDRPLGEESQGYIPFSMEEVKPHLFGDKTRSEVEGQLEELRVQVQLLGLENEGLKENTEFLETEIKKIVGTMEPRHDPKATWKRVGIIRTQHADEVVDEGRVVQMSQLAPRHRKLSSSSSRSVPNGTE